MELYLLLAVVGWIGGFLAGWVGLGGGIVLAPLLLYVPPSFGLSPFDMKEVARLTIIQSLCSSAAASVAHRRARQVHWELVGWMGTAIAVASWGGAFISELQLVSPDLLLGLFASLALVASVMMFLCPSDRSNHDKILAPHEVKFSRGRAVAVAIGVGFLGGMVGQSGAFLTIPLLIHVLRIPMRLAIGSSLGITFCAALSASLGKLAGGGTIVWPQVGALVAGSLLGSQLGSAVSHRGSAACLRYVLAALIGLSALRMWWQFLS